MHYSLPSNPNLFSDTQEIKPRNKMEESPMAPNSEQTKNRESHIVQALTLTDLNRLTREWYSAGYEFEQGIQYIPVGKTFMYVQVMTLK